MLEVRGLILCLLILDTALIRKPFVTGSPCLPVKLTPPSTSCLLNGRTEIRRSCLFSSVDCTSWLMLSQLHCLRNQNLNLLIVSKPLKEQVFPRAFIATGVPTNLSRNRCSHEPSSEQVFPRTFIGMGVPMILRRNGCSHEPSSEWHTLGNPANCPGQYEIIHRNGNQFLH